jgi:hypothetical protein
MQRPILGCRAKGRTDQALRIAERNLSTHQYQQYPVVYAGVRFNGANARPPADYAACRVNNRLRLARESGSSSFPIRHGVAMVLSSQPQGVEPASEKICESTIRDTQAGVPVFRGKHPARAGGGGISAAQAHLC